MEVYWVKVMTLHSSSPFSSIRVTWTTPHYCLSFASLKADIDFVESLRTYVPYVGASNIKLSCHSNWLLENNFSLHPSIGHFNFSFFTHSLGLFICFSMVMLISSFRTCTTDRSHIGHSSDFLFNEGTLVVSVQECSSLCSSQKYDRQWEHWWGKKSKRLHDGSAQFLPRCGSSIYYIYMCDCWACALKMSHRLKIVCE